MMSRTELLYRCVIRACVRVCVDACKCVLLYLPERGHDVAYGVADHVTDL